MPTRELQVTSPPSTSSTHILSYPDSVQRRFHGPNSSPGSSPLLSGSRAASSNAPANRGDARCVARTVGERNGGAMPPAHAAGIASSASCIIADRKASGAYTPAAWSREHACDSVRRVWKGFDDWGSQGWYSCNAAHSQEHMGK